MNKIEPANNKPSISTAVKQPAILKPPSYEARAQEKNRFSFLGYMLSYFTLPSLRREKISHDEIKKITKETGAEAVTIVGKGTTLTGSKIKLSGYRIEKEKAKKWIVYFLPNDGLAETNLALAKCMSDKLEVNVLVFNYRGVGHSTGYPSTASDLAEDGAACFDYLAEEGVQFSDICAYGHSIGGGAAAQLLSQEKYSSANLIADRTFTTLGAAIEQLGVDKFVLTKRVASWAKYFFEWSGWRFNNVENLTKIKGKMLITSTETKYDKMVGKCQLANGPLTIKYTPYRLEPKRKTEDKYTPDYHSLDIIGDHSHFDNPDKITDIFRAHIHAVSTYNSIRKWGSFKS